MNDLIISLDTSKGIPLYEQIYMYIKEDIKKGNLLCGQRLPSSRKLSMYLEVSRSTVELAYEQLVSEGYLETIPCKGYYIAEIDELYQFTHRLNEDTDPKKVYISQKSENIVKEQCDKSKQYAYDLSPNGIDLKNFPYNAWRKISKNVLNEENELFSIGASQGEYEFRVTICQYLHQARGMTCTPEQVIVGAGNEYLLMLLSTMMGQEYKIAFENPTYVKAYQVFRNLSHEVATVSMDQYGMCVNELEEVGADIAYVMPSHQYPTGVIMPIRRRLELLKWASKSRKRYIIEDDYDSEFRYKGKPIPALQGYDTHEKVIYLGTFSKSIAPAIRMSYMVLPLSLLDDYYEKSQYLSTTVSKIDQCIVNTFIKEGYYERHLNKTRAMYKSRHDVILQSLKPMLESGRCSVSGENAGVHVLLEFHDGSDEEELVKLAEAAAVRVYGMSQYYMEERISEKGTILLGYANLTEEEIVEAIKILCQCWKKTVDM